MAFLYRIIDPTGGITFPNANLITSEGNSNYKVAYQLAPNLQSRVIAIIFVASPTAWLVGCEPNVMAQLPNPKLPLQGFINGGGTWHFYTADGSDENGDFVDRQVVIDALASNISSANPQTIAPGTNIIGAQACVSSSLGAFRNSEIKIDTTWKGDHK